MSERPLSGIRILDSTVMTAGPWAVQILADLGAEVFKIERPRGFDVNRLLQPSVHGTSYFYLCMNKDKKCIEFDYSQPGHKEIYKKLVEKCDVVTENFKAGSTDRMGLGYDDLRQVKPDIIYSAVSGYGQTGPCAGLPASDLVVQATSGFMSVNGDKGSTGMKAGSSLADVYASTVSTIGLLAGILYRMETGEGVKVDTSMQCANMSSIAYELAKYLNTGEVDKPNGNANHEVGFEDTVPTDDGDLMVSAIDDGSFASFMKVLGCEDLVSDERFTDAAGRFENAEALKEIICPITKKYTMAQLASMCREADVIVGEVNTMDRAMRNTYIEDRGQISIVHDEYLGDCKTLNMPILFDKFEVPVRRGASHAGEDTKAVLQDLLGLSDEEVKALYSYEGAVKV